MENNQKKICQCEICNKKPSFICYKCMNYFCDICYKLIHEKKGLFQHKKEMIDYFIPIDSKCPSHPKYPNEYFCLDENGI